VAGIDAIGIGADFYDVKEETMVTGLGNVTRYPFPVCRAAASWVPG
jgi:microsomal dipeptidase-like Zn-dependent dipeptidase